MVVTQELRLSQTHTGDIVDITGGLQEAVGSSGIQSGTITVFTPSSTSAITTLEYEPGLQKDLPEFLERLIPSDKNYQHDLTWHDGNGFSHLRAALIGPDITVPFVGGKLVLGTWQQVVFLEFDNKTRDRRLVLQVMGE
jgi:secondary thiamine-phosphate synthase enzyme